jgi:enoyl-CoA hydratase/carnithine racemase
MLTVLDEGDGERILTVRIDEATIDADLVGAVDSATEHAEHGGIENFVLEFTGGPDSVTGDFPAFRPGPGRTDMRYFARWDEALARISRLQAKTFAAYDGRVGAAAVHAGLVMDLRVASAGARLSLGSLSEGRFPGMGAYWLPKFIGLGNARKIFLLGEDLTASSASRIGLVDVVEDTVEAAVDATIKAMRTVTPEAACFTRRILDDCYLLEHSAAAELAKAARYKVGIPNHDSLTHRRALAREGVVNVRDPQPQFSSQFTSHGHRPSAGPALLDRGRARLRFHRVDGQTSRRRDVVQAD